MTLALGIPLRKASADARASAPRSAVDEKTTHSTSSPQRSAASRRIVPPQPISMSSEWAPSARIRFGLSRAANSPTCSIAARYSTGPSRLTRGLPVIRPGFPDLPRTLPAKVHVLEQLLFPEGVHAGPEAVVLVREELAFRGQPPERLLDELVAVIQ